MIDDIEPMVVERSFHLEPGDRMLLCADGPTEAENPKQEQYRIERVEESVVRSKGKLANEIVNTIFTDLTAFTDAARIHDDITLVVIRTRE